MPASPLPIAILIASLLAAVPAAAASHAAAQPVAAAGHGAAPGGGHADHTGHGMPAAGGAGHGGHGAAGTIHPPGSAEAPSTRAFRAANEAMHSGMDIDFTGDADLDFARGMIAHHKGAIDMARIVLDYGKDPELAALAREIIAAQEKEVAFLESWLAAHEAKPTQ